jgi:Phage tail tube protein
VTLLSKLGYVGIAKEVTQGTYVAPAFYLPCTKIDAEDVFIELRDESYRNNDSLLQGIYQGAGDSTFMLDMMAYPDALPYLLRAVVGPDTVTAGVSTTLSANSAANAATLSLTASVASNSVIQVSDTAGANLEYVKIGTVTGAGPYSAPVTVGGGTGGNTTQFAHTAIGGSVISQSVHTFKQNPAAAQTSWSLTKYDVFESRGFPGCKLSEVNFKIDPKAVVTASAKFTGWLSAVQSNPTPTFSSAVPGLGWGWAMTNAGGSSTRGMTYDVMVKRAIEAIHSSDGVQNPREVFLGVLEADGTYKAIYESDADLNLYLQYLQQPTTATVTQPVLSGGSVITFTTSKSGWFKGKVDLSTVYVSADFSLSGIYNTTDNGAFSATVSNYSATPL